MLRDIGIDMEGDLEILVPRETPLPHEFSCSIQTDQKTEILLYEGNYVCNEKNVLVGRYPLNSLRFTFTLNIHEDRRVTVRIDDKRVDAFLLNSEPCPVPIEPRRVWLNARNDFCEYLKSTKRFVEDPMVKTHLPEWKWVLEKIEWAEQILEYEVTADEFRFALDEIELQIQPLLEKTRHKIHRSPLDSE